MTSMRYPPRVPHDRLAMLQPTPHNSPNPPTLRGGRYVIAGVLGKGGHAQVYQAWDTNLRAWRAIKVLSPQFLDDDEVRTRFAQEAATMARLDHRNLVKVYDISDEGSTPHIVMELCEAGAVIDWMKKFGAVPPRTALQVIRQIALGVQSAHEDGIIHRDIKPQNVLIDQYGIAKLTDFGIARQEDSHLTRVGATMGTYAFMAPEQRHDSTQVDERADIYGLGATLFTLARVKTTTELFIAEPDDPIFGDLPEALIAFVLKACAYRPRERFQTIDAFVEAIDALLPQMPEIPADSPAIEALATPLPMRAPDTLPDLSELSQLLEALALGVPEEEEATTIAPPLDITTLGSSVRPPPTPQVQSATPAPARPAAQMPFDLMDDEEEEEAVVPVVRTSSSLARLALPLVAIGGLAGLAVVGLVVVLLHGSIVVSGAASTVRQAEKDLITNVLASRPVIPELANPDALQALYDDVRDGDAATSARSARAFADSLERSVAAKTPKGDAILLSRNILEADRKVDRADEVHAEAASTLTGSLAVMVRLAPSP